MLWDPSKLDFSNSSYENLICHFYMPASNDAIILYDILYYNVSHLQGLSDFCTCESSELSCMLLSLTLTITSWKPYPYTLLPTSSLYTYSLCLLPTPYPYTSSLPTQQGKPRKSWSRAHCSPRSNGQHKTRRDKHAANIRSARHADIGARRFLCRAQCSPKPSRATYHESPDRNHQGQAGSPHTWIHT